MSFYCKEVHDSNMIPLMYKVVKCRKESPDYNCFVRLAVALQTKTLHYLPAVTFALFL
jgi:hypothetical protein